MTSDKVDVWAAIFLCVFFSAFSCMLGAVMMYDQEHSKALAAGAAYYTVDQKNGKAIFHYGCSSKGRTE